MLEDTQVEEVITQRSVVSVIQRKHPLQVTAGRFECFYNNSPFKVLIILMVWHWYYWQQNI